MLRRKDMNLQENIPTQLRRRTHLLDRVIDNLLPNMYPCDYNSSDHFVEGVIDEIRWFLLDVEELQGIERADIVYYIIDYKYDELTEYFNERCIVLQNDNLQESIRRILREEILKEAQYLGSCVEVGDEDSNNFINRIFSDATEMAYYVGNPDEEDLGKSEKISKKEFFSKIDKETIKKKVLRGEVEYFYIPDLDIYFIYNVNKDIHYFYRS